MRIRLLLLMGLVLLPGAVAAAPAETTKPKTVDCDAGQTLAGALSKLDKRGPNTLTVSGTCRENVAIRGFDDLRIEAPGAVLIPASVGLGTSALEVVGSRFVTIDGLTVHGGDVEAGIRLRSCADCRLTNCLVDGDSVFGIMAFDSSSVTVSACTLQGAGYAGMGVAASFAVVANAVFDGSQGRWVGIAVSANGSANVLSSVLRNHGVGIWAGEGGQISIGDWAAPGPQDSTVTVEGNWCQGVWVETTSKVTTVSRVFNRLRVLGNGSDCWGTGVNVDTGGVFYTYSPIEVTDNTSGGIRLNHHALARLAGGGSVSGNQGPGVAAYTDSMAIGPQAPPWEPSLEVQGNQGNDLQCDSTSMITNAARLTGATNVSCVKLWDEDLEPSSGGGS